MKRREGESMGDKRLTNLVNEAYCFQIHKSYNPAQSQKLAGYPKWQNMAISFWSLLTQLK